MYVAGNPVMLVDPDGRKVVLTGTEEENQAYVAQLNSTLTTYQVELCGRKNNKLRIVGGNNQQLSGNASALDKNVQLAINKGKNVFTPVIDDPSIDFVQENSNKVDAGDLSRLSENDKPLKEALFLRMYIDANFGQGKVGDAEMNVIQYSYNIRENFYEKGRVIDPGWRKPRGEVGLSSKSNGVGLFIFGRIEIEITFDKNGIVTGSRAYQVGQLNEKGYPQNRTPSKSK
jgi:hypothetical protein